MVAPSSTHQELPQRTALYVLGGLVAVVFVARLTLLATVQGLPGVDGGAYLMSANEALGAPSLGIDNAVRPFLSPGWLLVPFLLLFGTDGGFSVFQAAFGIVPMAAVYVLALQVTSSRTVALVGALFTGFDLAMAEMLVTGVEPLVGWGAIILVLVGVLRLRDGWEPKGIALVAGGIVASAYTSMTASGVGGLLLPVLAVALAVTDKRAGVLVRAALPALAGIVLALPALPAYIGTRPGLLDYGGELVYYAPRAIDYVVLLWALGVAAGVVRMTDRRDAMRVLALAGVLLATLTLFRSTDEVVINLFFRPAYYVPVFLWIETAWLLLRIPRWRWYAIGGLFAFVLLLYPMVFSGQVTYSSFATPEFVQVVQLHRSSRTSTPTTGRWSRTVGARTVDRRPYRQSHLSVLRPQREPAQPPGRLPDGAGASKALRPVGCGGVNWRCVDETRPTKTEPTWKAAPGPLGATTTSWPRARSPQAPR